MAEKFLELKNVTVKSAAVPVLENIDIVFHRGEQWVITGSSGSGKTVLAHTLAGKYFYSGKIEYFFPLKKNNKSTIGLVEEQHRFKNLSNTHDLYYQQRFNSSDSELTMTVEHELMEYGFDADFVTSKWLDDLHVRDLLQKPLIQLSNGENKRTQIAIALLQNPELLILDSPFTGLDSEGRETLHQIIKKIIGKRIHVLLIAPLQEIPESATHIVSLEKGKIRFAGKKENFHFRQPAHYENKLDSMVMRQLKPEQEDNFRFAIRMIKVNVQYGDKKILKDINWEVKKGEGWSLSGPNGAGKSTLLSLVTADNPQAYANEIYLFDKRRGSGESIWDVKKKIGFVSPELHVYFDYSATCFEVIASGLFDTIGLFRRLTNAQEQKVFFWLKLLELESVKSKRLVQLSLGEQRRSLLARALVKSPPLLILDEPCQGLDEEQTLYFSDFITQACLAFHTTLVYVSHYPRQIPGCVNHFLELKDGAEQKIGNSKF